MATLVSRAVNQHDLESVQAKLEDYLSRELSQDEQKAFKKLVDGGNFDKTVKTGPGLFQAKSKPDVTGLAHALEDVSSQELDSPDWVYVKATWTYHF